MRESGKKLLAVILFMTILYSLALSVWTYNEVSKVQPAKVPTGKASYGKVSLCINDAPTIDASTCSNSALQNSLYTCKVNASDKESGPLTLTIFPVLVQRVFSNATGLPFNMTPDGNISFIPSNDDVGNFTFNLITNDGSGCANSLSSLSFDLEVINVNDPPYLIANIPDVSFFSGETILAFTLNDYFRDPDNDSLTYVVSGNNLIEVTIFPSSLVQIRSSTCGVSELVIFTAIDPYNATAESNPVLLTCTNTTTPTPTTQSPGSASGGGSGGGGAALLCKSEFECFDHHRCNVTSQKIQRCIDKKGCRRDEYLTLPCFYQVPKSCFEAWNCTAWGPCMPNNTMTRSCIDTNSCGTLLEKPVMVQDCIYVGTCTDGIKNCHSGSCEEGIDCGGPCNSCQSVQVPYPFEEQAGYGIYFITLLILLILAAILAYHYFRKEIKSAIARVGWLVHKHKKKQFLLSRIEQQKLLAEIDALDKKLSIARKNEEVYEVVSKAAGLLNLYFSKALAWKEEVEHALLKQALDKRKGRIRPILREIFLSMSQGFDDMIKGYSVVNALKAKLALEELRNIVLQTSEVAYGEYQREVQEIKHTDKHSLVERITIKVINTFIALQFEEVEVAKKLYLELLADYERVSVKEEELVFSDLRRLYENINYVNAWALQAGAAS